MLSALALLLGFGLAAISGVQGAPACDMELPSFFVRFAKSASSEQISAHLSDMQASFKMYYGEQVLASDIWGKVGLGQAKAALDACSAELMLTYAYELPGFTAYHVKVREAGGGAKSGGVAGEESVLDRFLRMSKAGNSPVEQIEPAGIATLAVDPDELAVMQAAMLSSNGAVVDTADVALNNGTRQAAAPSLASLYARLDVSLSKAMFNVSSSRQAKGLSTQDIAPWNLVRVSSRASAGQLSSTSSGTYAYDDAGGAGVDVYIIDSGLYTGHLDFVGGRAVLGQDFTGAKDAGDDLGHGTHVGGVIGGSLFGVAKNARLIGVKVFGPSGKADWGVILAGMNWAFAQARASGRKSVMNLSLRGDLSQSVNLAVAAMVASGVPVMAAAGNDAADACAYSPGSSEAPLLVGAMAAGDGFLGSSNRGPCVDILAPGKDILSDWIGSPLAVRFLSGTSMATPHVTGIAALLWSQRPWLSGLEVMQLVRAVATRDLVSGLPSADTPNLLAYNQL